MIIVLLDIFDGKKNIYSKFIWESHLKSMYFAADNLTNRVLKHNMEEGGSEKHIKYIFTIETILSNAKILNFTRIEIFESRNRNEHFVLSREKRKRETEKSIRLFAHVRVSLAAPHPSVLRCYDKF